MYGLVTHYKRNRLGQWYGFISPFNSPISRGNNIYFKNSDVNIGDVVSFDIQRSVRVSAVSVCLVDFQDAPLEPFLDRVVLLPSFMNDEIKDRLSQAIASVIRIENSDIILKCVRQLLVNDGDGQVFFLKDHWVRILTIMTIELEPRMLLDFYYKFEFSTWIEVFEGIRNHWSLSEQENNNVRDTIQSFLLANIKCDWSNHTCLIRFIFKKDVVEIKKMQEALKVNRIFNFFHMTDLSNLSNILDRGLLSHHNAHKDRLVQKDISMSEVQDRRDAVHTFVPFYFNVRNPMMYLRKDEDSVIVLQFSSSLYLLADEFTDGNAGSNNTNRFSTSNIENFSQLNWNKIRARYWNSDDKFEYWENKRMIMAELLVQNRVSMLLCESIICRRYSQKVLIEKCLGDWSSHISVSVNPDLFFVQ